MTHAPPILKTSILEIRDLSVSFQITGRRVPVVEGVSLSIPRGKVVALVGESGCGKSVTALSVLRLLPEPPAAIDSGAIWLTPPGERSENDPVDLLQLRDRELRRVRGARVAMVFQEPLTSLHPVLTAGEQIVEAIRLHEKVSRRDARARAIALLDDVGIDHPSQRFHAYAHELSGGMRQRVMIAMALAADPEVLIADEPTTALDSMIRSQILDLLAKLQEARGLGVLLITHDLGVVARVADEVAVMYAGRIVERATARALFANPQHPYTLGLMQCVPRTTGDAPSRLAVIEGNVPRPESKPPGCAFHPRCLLARQRAALPGADTIALEPPATGVVPRRCITTTETARSGQPNLREISPGHLVACWEIAAPPDSRLAAGKPCP